MAQGTFELRSARFDALLPNVNLVCMNLTSADNRAWASIVLTDAGSVCPFFSPCRRSKAKRVL